VIYLPHLSNASDFNALAAEHRVRLRFVRSPQTLGAPDLIIIPGTKNTLWDLNFLRKTGWETALKSALHTTPIMGICGGLEMMGQALYDPHGIESYFREMHGLGFFEFTTHFAREKKIAQVEYSPTNNNPFKEAGKVKGYEIHCGKISYGSKDCPLFNSIDGVDGVISESPFVFGTFIHDVFKNPRFTRCVIDLLRKNKGLLPLSEPLIGPQEELDEQCDRLANIIEENLTADFNLKA
jgi:adenosylcobyric acid synthase